MDYFRHLNYAAVLLVMLVLFVFKFPRRKYFVLRLVVALAGFFSVALFMPDNFFGSIVPVNAISIMLMLVAGCWFCFDVSLKVSVFCCVGTALSQHMAAHVYGVLYCLFTDAALTPEQGSVPYLFGVRYMLCYFIGYISSYTFSYFTFVNHNKDLQSVQIKGWKFILLISVVWIIIYFVWEYAIDAGYSMLLVYRMIAAICCFALLNVLFMSDGMDKARLEQAVLGQMLSESQAHYESLSLSIESVNRKYHDLKYQLSALRESGNDDILDKLESDLSTYARAAKTGNIALDNTLSEKEWVCEHKQIELVYMLDGARLTFMEPLDVYVLFGNALDNAIECVQKYSDPACRFISLQMFANDELLKVRIENYCEEEVVFKDGFPQTSKTDKSMHGFGVKSIVHIAKKYGGNVVMYCQDKLFCMDILFFVKKQENSSKK